MSSTTASIYQQFVHCGEERELSPAFIVNMIGCNLSCPTCSERMHWQTAKRTWHGDAQTYAEKLAPHLDSLELRAFEWIGGEPTLYLPFVLEATALLKQRLKRSIPFYLNTNGYYAFDQNEAITRLLDGFVFDLKCCSACAPAIVGPVPDYYDRVCANIVEACKSSCDVIVRHLLMPGHFACCTRPCVDWLLKNVPKARVNLMTTFQNFNDCPDYPFSLSADERRQAEQLLQADRPNLSIY